MEIYRKHKRTTQTTKKREIPISIISYMEWIDHYRNLLTEERLEYKKRNTMQDHAFI
jgi:hypothetical protein